MSGFELGVVADDFTGASDARVLYGAGRAGDGAV